MLKTEIIQGAPFYVIGYTTSTNSDREMSYEDSAKGQLFGYMSTANWLNSVNDKVSESIVCVYHSFGEGEDPDFKITIGVPTSSDPSKLNKNLDVLAVPKTKYIQIESTLGPFPDIVMETWLRVSEMSLEELGGQRSRTFDQEWYSLEQFETHHCKFLLKLALSGK